MIDKSQLILGSNYERFPASRFKCPQCSGDALIDNSSPNYCGGHIDGNGNSYDGGSIKHVCLACVIHFIILWWNNVENGVPDIGDKAINITPLVERDGKYLVPLDVENREYKDKHGEWPIRSYG